MNPYQHPSTEQIMQISKQLNEDETKLKHFVLLFKDWLKCQEYLPQEIGKYVKNRNYKVIISRCTDEQIMASFIRMCKMDLRKAKLKFESSAISTLKHPQIYLKGEVDESFFQDGIHKMVVPLPKMTEDGYRVFLLHEIDSTGNQFDFHKMVMYMFMLGNFTLLEDTNAGIKAIYDFGNVSIQHTKQVNFKLIGDGIEATTAAFPFRFPGAYIINLPPFLQILFQWTLSILPEKVRKRITVLKNPEDLLNHFSKEILPEDYFGTEESTELLGEKWKKYFLENKDWFQKFEKLKLKGPVSKIKQWNFSEMEGSFRKLSID